MRKVKASDELRPEYKREDLGVGESEVNTMKSIARAAMGKKNPLKWQGIE